ncbi:MAG: RNA-directed DNA polymerase [Cyanothece sp. SIO1E1]|nr:RNA-directed DNA polymerase [Cyanothece sp. SIO1E1]
MLLIESQFPNQIKKWIISLLESTTARVSRGIPVGPHATHLLAEISLIPIDNSMYYKEIDFCRYADDIIIFCKDYTQAKIVIYKIAEILDKQQRLVLQKQKTKI